MNRKLPLCSIVAITIPVILALTFILPAIVRADFSLPAEILDKVEVVSICNLKEVVTPTKKAMFAEQQLICANLVSNALKEAGKGGVYEGKVLKVTKAFPIYRAYTQKVDPEIGHNNRFGSWWTFVPPDNGMTKSNYRQNYEICKRFNLDLDRVAQCTIYPGALLLTGPGQSVDTITCPGESYPADAEKSNLQIFIHQMGNHTFQIPGQHEDNEHYVGCPVESEDHFFEWYSQRKSTSN